MNTVALIHWIDNKECPECYHSRLVNPKHTNDVILPNTFICLISSDKHNGINCSDKQYSCQHRFKPAPEQGKYSVCMKCGELEDHN